MTINRQLETLELKTHSTLLPRSSDTTCQMITLSVTQVPSVPEPTQTSLQTEMLPRSPNAQSPMCLKNYYYLTLFHHPTPHQAPTSALLSKISTCIWKAQSGKV